MLSTVDADYVRKSSASKNIILVCFSFAQFVLVSVHVNSYGDRNSGFCFTQRVGRHNLSHQKTDSITSPQKRLGHYGEKKKKIALLWGNLVVPRR